MPAGMPRISANSLVTFLAMSWPPKPGLAPWLMYISRPSARFMSWMFQPSRPPRHWKISCLAAPRWASLMPPSPVFSAMSESAEAMATACLVERDRAP